MALRTVEDLDELRRAASSVAVLGAWQKNGVLAALVDGPRALSELPGNPRALRITAPILAALGILERHGERVGLSPAGRALLESRSILGRAWLDGFAELSRLDRVLAEGGPVPDAEGKRRPTDGGIFRDDPAAARAFLGMLYDRAAASAPATARWIADAFGTGRALDLGGGHGRYAEELQKLGFDVTLLDVGICVQVARDRYGSRLKYLEGDFFEADLGGPWNLVLASNIVHGLSPEENLGLFRRVRDVLEPGGHLVLKDMFLDDLRSGPAEAVWFGLIMLNYTAGGQTYTLDELKKLASDAGLRAGEAVVAPTWQLLPLTRD